MIVAKFGGTSMGTASAMKQASKIVQEMKSPKVVIVSATSGTTDKLIDLSESALKNKDWQKSFKELFVKHEQIIKELGIKLDLKETFAEIQKILNGIALLGELSLSAKDRLLVFGEKISAMIFAGYLKNQHLDAEICDAYDLIYTDNNFGEGNVDFIKSSKAIRSALLKSNKNFIPIITGFTGQAENGHYITLGRGGSDYSAAIVAYALDADELQIWTDVDGIFNTDPRVVPEAKVLELVSFNEASELAYFGAKVLHPKTIKPAIEKNIPVKVLNTFNPTAKGTLITKKETESLKAVSFKKGISIINICSAGMLMAYGFLAKIFEIFSKHGVVVDVISTSEVSVSLTVENGAFLKVEKDLSEFASVTIYENMAIVCLVGEGIKSEPKIMSRLFSCIENYNISMVSVGASQRNITFLVKENESLDIVKKVYKQFFN